MNQALQMPQTEPKPKQGMLRRIFGDPISSSTDKAWPELRQVWSGRQIERPDLEGNVSSIKPMGIINKFIFKMTIIKIIRISK